MGIATVLGQAGLSAPQYANASNVATTLANLHMAPVDIAAAAQGVTQVSSVNDVVGAVICKCNSSGRNWKLD